MVERCPGGFCLGDVVSSLAQAVRTYLLQFALLGLENDAAVVMQSFLGRPLYGNWNLTIVFFLSIFRGLGKNTAKLKSAVQNAYIYR